MSVWMYEHRMLALGVVFVVSFAVVYLIAVVARRRENVAAGREKNHDVLAAVLLFGSFFAVLVVGVLTIPLLIVSDAGHRVLLEDKYDVTLDGLPSSETLVPVTVDGTVRMCLLAGTQRMTLLCSTPESLAELAPAS